MIRSGHAIQHAHFVINLSHLSRLLRRDKEHQESSQKPT